MASEVVIQLGVEHSLQRRRHHQSHQAVKISLSRGFARYFSGQQLGFSINEAFLLQPLQNLCSTVRYQYCLLND